jgi:hypothetical protein
VTPVETWLAASYYLVPPDCLDDAESLVARILRDVAAPGPIQLCREMPEGLAPAAVPPPAGAADEAFTVVRESWIVSLRWREQALRSPMGADLATRLIVRTPWPLSAEAELVLLEARLAAPGLSLAVPVEPDRSDETFLYLNRLGFPWIALPEDGAGFDSWAEAIARMCRLWCLDARTRTPMEPLRTGFSGLLAARLGRRLPRWRYRIADVADGGAIRLEGAVWTPSVHSLLVGSARAALARPLEGLPRAETRWTEVLRRICNGVETARLEELFQPVAEAARPGGGA